MVSKILRYASLLNIILLLLWIFFLPTQLGKFFFFDFSSIYGVRVDYLAPAFYATDIISLFLLLFNFKAVSTFIKNKYVLIFLALLIPSVAFSTVPQLGIYRIVKIVEVLGIFAVFRSFVIPPFYLLATLTASAFVQAILAAWQFATHHSVQGIFYWLGERYLTQSLPDIAKASLQGVEFLRAYGTFSHPNSMAGFYLLLYMFALTYTPFGKFFRLKALFLGLSIALIFLSFSKTAMFLLVLGNVYYIATSKQAVRCLPCRIARPIVFLALGSLIFLAQGDALSLTKRLNLFSESGILLQEHSLFGVGLNQFIVAASRFPTTYSSFFAQPVHNIFALFLTECGVVVSTFLVGLIWIKRKRIPWSESLCYIITIVVLTGMVDHYWLTLQQNLLLVPFILALLSPQSLKRRKG
ncbi:hypothetical protein HGB07_02955 [Candidatus Roizmanbacteria bacterium]|nr:hypothetical protein [Candidatus Roizmanbacteria bacterium]